MAEITIGYIVFMVTQSQSDLFQAQHLFISRLLPSFLLLKKLFLYTEHQFSRTR